MNNEQLQEYLNKEVKKIREEKLADSPQWRIGDLINALDNIPTEYGSDKQAVSISFDFGTAFPAGLSSWRGSYSELAINYALGGYDNDNASQFAHKDLKEFLEELKSAVGKEFTGWKGGEYRMTINTPLWVANDGNVGNTGVVGIKNNNYEVIILTQYCEY